MGFDLREREWLPVQAADGLRQVGLRELFLRAHEFSDVAVALPPAASGLWRVLYAIAGRVSGLDRQTGRAEEWADRRDELLARGRFDGSAVEEYFARFGDRFDLFDEERPWMQDPRLLDQCGKATGVNKLVVSRPSGNNQVFFGHHVDADPEPLPVADAVLYLLAWHFYGPSGRCTSRTVGATAAADTSAGPLRRTISFHPLGENVFESLVTGLVPPASLDVDGSEDVCPWERPDLADPMRPNLGRPGGVCSVLTGRSQHALLLTPSADGASVVDARITWAWRVKLPPVNDPYLVRQVSQKGDWYTRQANADRALWRDLDALLLQSRDADAKVKQPPVFETAAWLPGDVRHRLRVRAFGFDQDGQTRDRQWFSAVTPPVLAYLEQHEPEAAGWVAELREAAEDVHGRLVSALRRVWHAATMPPTVNATGGRGAECPWLREAAGRYWPAAEDRFWKRVAAGRSAQPARPFVELGEKVFEQVTDTVATRPRVARVREMARGLLWAAVPRRAA